jgi:hypothetical protein
LNISLPELPTGNSLLVFSLCLLIGAFVILKFSLEQFPKPCMAADTDPWNFVPLPLLTSKRQYLNGLFLYAGTLTLIFLAVSIVGPSPFVEIARTIAVTTTQHNETALPSTASLTLQNSPTFPILVCLPVPERSPPSTRSARRVSPSEPGHCYRR